MFKKDLLGVLLIFCFGLFFWQIFYLSDTFIDEKTIALIIIGAGFISSSVYFYFNKTLNKSDYFFVPIKNTIYFGFTLSFLIIYINYNWRDSFKNKELLKIVRSSYKDVSFNVGRYQRSKADIRSVFIVIYKNISKEIVWNSRIDEIEMSQYKYLELEIRKGYFNYDVIENNRILVINAKNEKR